MESVGKVFSHFDQINSEDEKNLEKELFGNKLLTEDIKNISQTIIPFVPYIGLAFAGVSVGKFVYNKYAKSAKSPEEEKTKNES